MRRLLAVAVAAVLSIGFGVGCGESDDDGSGGNTPPAETGTFVAGCDHGGGLCTDLYAAQGVDTTGVAAEIASGCSSHGWTPRTSACPTADRIGTCNKTTPINNVSLQSRDRIYSTYAGTNVSSECTTRGGTWVAN